MEKQKSRRSLSRLEYYERLQYEYLIAELRSKIYSSSKDRTYYRDRVMVGKRSNIEDISKRNNLPSIFTSTDVYDIYYNQIYVDSYPNFMYADECEQLQFEQRDREEYYGQGEFVILATKETCKMIEADLIDGICKVTMRNTKEEKHFKLEELKRIL